MRFVATAVFLLAHTSIATAQQPCTPPPRDCAASAEQCRQLLPFEPITGLGYDNYPINGETTANQFRSYARRELIALVKYAAGAVACKAANWTPGNRQPLGLGDMSESNGAIPGTSVGRPGHPKNTHTNGRDIDIAYYQLKGPDNHLRPVCPHADQHCIGPPNNLDARRTALFIGELLTSSRTRVIGVDGRIKPVIVPALKELCSDGTVSAIACARANISKIAAETTNTKKGWFKHHHHHLHLSLHTAGAPAPSDLLESIAPDEAVLTKDLEELESRQIPGHVRPE